MEEPKKIWIGAEWQAERDHYGLDKRCGMFSTERFHEDDKGYVPADLTDALVEAAEEVIKSATGAYNHKWDDGWICSKCGVRRAYWIESDIKTTTREELY